MRQGTINADYVKLLTSRMEHNITGEELEGFSNKLHIMTQWQKTVPVTVSYLHSLVIPIHKITAALYNS